jgi:soluble cytochrome b562
MKIRCAFVLLLAVPATTTLLKADDQATVPPPPTAVPAAVPDADKKTDLEVRMDKVGKAFRKLRKQVADPTQNASSLELLSKMQAAMKEAEALTPAKAQDLPEDQRAKFVEDFKSGIMAMEDEFAKLSDAITAGKNDDAVKIVAEIQDLEKKDHKEFKRPEKD